VCVCVCVCVCWLDGQRRRAWWRVGAAVLLAHCHITRPPSHYTTWRPLSLTRRPHGVGNYDSSARSVRHYTDISHTSSGRSSRFPLSHYTTWRLLCLIRRAHGVGNYDYSAKSVRHYTDISHTSSGRTSRFPLSHYTTWRPHCLTRRRKLRQQRKISASLHWHFTHTGSGRTSRFPLVSVVSLFSERHTISMHVAVAINPC